MPDAYRAPEAILWMEWDDKVDIWSVAVLVSGRPVGWLILSFHSLANSGHASLALGSRLKSPSIPWAKFRRLS